MISTGSPTPRSVPRLATAAAWTVGRRHRARALSLLGLVRHLAEVECGWLRMAAAGEQLDYLYCSAPDPDGDIDSAGSTDPASDFAVYRREIRLADAAVAELGLDHRCRHPNGTEYSLRWVYLHLIEEYARHNGHADLLRERIDGRTGD
ncbi:DinB family protein [Nocardia testacea]|uniref:DinB family protein n=1 Tax=Nocardia testacea TaxID=248551 RepID=UPI000A00E776|nr:DinB family protein [Nocardia testacea]